MPTVRLQGISENNFGDVISDVGSRLEHLRLRKCKSYTKFSKMQRHVPLGVPQTATRCQEAKYRELCFLRSTT
jgi:hypothetical protein